VAPRGAISKPDTVEPASTAIVTVLASAAAIAISLLSAAHIQRERAMCRNIRTLFNFEPPATDDEIRAAALQFVRKVSGFNKPSQANDAAFQRAVNEVTRAADRLLRQLKTDSPPRDREIEAEKARARARERYALF
jgi:hypothetical protein